MRHKHETFDVIEQPVDKWAKEMNWNAYDRDLKFYTLDPGIDSEKHILPFFQSELAMAFKTKGENVSCVIQDRWDIGIRNRLLSVGPKEYRNNWFFVDQVDKDVLSDVFMRFWEDIYFILCYGERAPLPGSIEEIISQYASEGVGKFLPPDVQSLLCAGHDNTYLHLIVRQYPNDAFKRVDSLCRKYDKELKIVCPLK